MRPITTAIIIATFLWKCDLHINIMVATSSRDQLTTFDKCIYVASRALRDVISGGILKLVHESIVRQPRGTVSNQNNTQRAHIKSVAHQLDLGKRRSPWVEQRRQPQTTLEYNIFEYYVGPSVSLWSRKEAVKMHPVGEGPKPMTRHRSTTPGIILQIGSHI